MKLRKAQARLERRLAGYAETVKNLGSDRARGFRKPGSSKRGAPKGRGLR